MRQPPRAQTFACTCGTVQGTAHDLGRGRGAQLNCQCDDCRHAVIWLGHPDPGPKGIRYVQIGPDQMTFDRGVDQLRVLAWKNPRLLRWYASCCATPLFNTLDTPKWAFASVMVDRLSAPAALAPCTAQAFVPKPNGKTTYKGIARFARVFFRRVLRARLTGRWRKNPLFDETGAPITAPYCLTPQDRAAAKSRTTA